LKTVWWARRTGSVGPLSCRSLSASISAQNDAWRSADDGRGERNYVEGLIPGSPNPKIHIDNIGNQQPPPLSSLLSPLLLSNYVQQWATQRVGGKKQTKGCPARNRTDRDADPGPAGLPISCRRGLLYETVSVCCLFAVHRTFQLFAAVIMNIIFSPGCCCHLSDGGEYLQESLVMSTAYLG
jgi:hypothetical protein